MPLFNDPNFPKPGAQATRAPKLKPTFKPPATLRAQSASSSATFAVPLKTNEQASESTPAVKQAYEPYNPYPARNRPPPKMRTQTSIRDWVIFAIMSASILGGILLISTFFIQKAMEKQIVKSIAKTMLPLRSVAIVTIGNVKVSLFRQSVRLNDVRIEIQENEKHPAHTLTIAHASVWGLDWKSMKRMVSTRKALFPETMRISLDGVHLDQDILGVQGQALMQSMGYKDLALSLSAGVNFSKANKSFDLEDLQIEAAKVGRFDISLSLGNLTLPTSAEIARLKADPKLILTETGDFTKVTFRSFEFGFRDESFINRASEALMKMGETSPATLAQMAIDVNTTPRGLAPANSDFVKPGLETLLRFLQNPTSIKLSARPPKPIAVMSLFDDRIAGSINELAHRLNMTVE